MPTLFRIPVTLAILNDIPCRPIGVEQGFVHWLVEDNVGQLAVQPALLRMRAPHFDFNLNWQL